jgi:hypothetical protein
VEILSEDAYAILSGGSVRHALYHESFRPGIRYEYSTIYNWLLKTYC